MTLPSDIISLVTTVLNAIKVSKKTINDIQDSDFADTLQTLQDKLESFTKTDSDQVLSEIKEYLKNKDYEKVKQKLKDYENVYVEIVQFLAAIGVITEISSIGQIDQIVNNLKEVLNIGYARFGSILLDVLGNKARQIYEYKINSDIRPNLLSPSDIVRAIVRDPYLKPTASTPNILKEYLSKLGYSDQDIDRIWNAHWEIPNISETVNLFRRGLITKSEAKDLLVLNDIHPDWKEKYFKMLYRYPDRVEFRQMVRFLDFTDNEKSEIIRASGIDPKYINRFKEFLENQYVDNFNTRILTLLASMYENDLIDTDYIVSQMKYLKFGRYEIERFLYYCNLRRSVDSMLDRYKNIVKIAKKMSPNDAVKTLSEFRNDGSFLYYTMLRLFPTLSPSEIVNTIRESGLKRYTTRTFQDRNGVWTDELEELYLEFPKDLKIYSSLPSPLIYYINNLKEDLIYEILPISQKGDMSSWAYIYENNIIKSKIKLNNFTVNQIKVLKNQALGLIIYHKSLYNNFYINVKR